MSPFDPTVSDDENIEVMKRVLNVSDAEARFILAIEKGEIDGDVVLVDPVTLQPLNPAEDDG